MTDVTALSPQQLAETVVPLLESAELDARLLDGRHFNEQTWRDAGAALGELVRLADQAETPLASPYCQVVGCNAIVLLTSEQIDWLIREMGHYPITNDVAVGVSGEMHRAKSALARAALATGDCTQSPPASDSGPAGGEEHA